MTTQTDKRTLPKSPEAIEKLKVRTPLRSLAQYLRSCDSLVGRWLRLNDTTKYNETLEKADAASERKES